MTNGATVLARRSAQSAVNIDRRPCVAAGRSRIVDCQNSRFPLERARPEEKRYRYSWDDKTANGARAEGSDASLLVELSNIACLDHFHTFSRIEIRSFRSRSPRLRNARISTLERERARKFECKVQADEQTFKLLLWAQSCRNCYRQRVNVNRRRKLYDDRRKRKLYPLHAVPFLKVVAFISTIVR